MADSIVTKQALIDAQKDAQALEEVINGEPGKLIKTRLGRLVYTLASVPQINTMTREEVTSALAPKADKTETAAALDTKANQADTFLKSEVTSLVAPKADKIYVDSAVGAISTDASKQYATLALATADIANIALNKNIFVSEAVNGGYWYKATAGATNLTKSAYDPLTQAKADATTKANAAEANAKGYADLIAIKPVYLYEGSNLVGTNSKILAGMIYSDHKFTNMYSGQSVVVPVKEGDALYIHNSRQTMTSSSGFWYGFYANEPIVGDTRIANTVTTLTDTPTGLTYLRVIVPVGAKYLVLNTRFNANTAQWSVNKTAFTNSFLTGSPVVVGVEGAAIKTVDDYFEYGVSKTLIGSVYDPLMLRTGVYLSAQKIASGQATWTVAAMQMDLGREYYAKIDSIAFPFGISTFNGTVAAAQAAAIGTDAPSVTLQLIDEVNKIYKLKPAATFTGGCLLIATIIDTGGYTHNISETLKVWADYESAATSKTEGYSELKGKKLIDLELRKKFGLVARNNDLLSKLGNLRKSIYCFGDSITQGTQGGYTIYLQMGLDATIQNYGSSGANTNRLYGIVLGKKSRNGFDGTTVFPAKDYTLADIVTIMIGTNDFDYGDPYWSSLSTIPSDTVYAHIADDTTDAYFESFPANFAGNVGACIEYIRWKNPKCKIYLIAPPQRLGSPTMLTRVPFIKAVADYYAVTFVNGTSENGLCLKDISVWSYDNLHLNTLGNEIFGKYLAKKIASS